MLSALGGMYCHRCVGATHVVCVTAAYLTQRNSVMPEQHFKI